MQQETSPTKKSTSVLEKLPLCAYNSLSTTFGSLAQLVEQRIEDPRVPSSSLGGATK